MDSKFQVSSLSHSRDILGDYKFKMGHVTWPHPFQCQFVICRLGLAMFNPHTKFEMSTMTYNEEVKGNDAMLSYHYCRLSTCIQLMTGHVNCFG